MSAKANPTAVGGFILGAIALLVLCVVLFGGSVFFSKTTQMVIYFEGGVSGLQVGSPVTFRGVEIGSVSAVRLLIDARNLKARIPVYINIDPAKITFIDKHETQVDLPKAIELGLRARLQTQSFVTGQLGVELDILPDVPAQLFGGDEAVPELPAAPSTIEALKEKLAKLPLDELVHSTLKTVQDIDAIITAPEVKQMLVSFAGAGNSLKQMMDENVKPTIEALQQTLTDAQKAEAAIRDLAQHTDGQLTETNKELQRVLGDLDQAIRQGQTTLGSINTLIQPNTPSRANIDQALRDLALTMQSLRSLTQEIERNPSALLTGRR
jgi:paraquat-inducible protein B